MRANAVTARATVDGQGLPAHSGGMATQLSREFQRRLGELSYEPTEKRVRANSGGRTFADSRRTVLVWEPKRIVPSYAFPDEDLDAALVPAPPEHGEREAATAGRPVLDPSVGFAAHTCDGEPLSLELDGAVLAGVGFRPASADLAGYVILDFAAFDEWLEEDEPIVGHPRDPFSRIDIRRGSSRVRVEVDGQVLADSTSPLLLFETGLPTRFYLPAEDVRLDLFTPSTTRTTCAYKGHASYWSVDVGGRTYADLAWTYERPLPGTSEIAGHVTFFDERVDLTLDGVRRSRPTTPWSDE